MPYPSTFSIVAYDPDAPAWGIAVASKFPAVGAVVPWAQAGVGAVATQSYANTAFGPQGLALMAQGLSAEEALAQLLAADPEREKRQVGLVDAQGRAATFTGRACHGWAGGLTGEGFAVQGNILTGPEVVEAMARAFTEATGPLYWRLHAALLAGDRAGGDRRGRQSAAIFVVKPQSGYGGFNDRWVDYRVDDHPDPVARLADLLELHDLYFGEADPADRLPIQGEVLADLERLLVRQGYLPEPTGGWTPAFAQALETFIGNENFEERVDLAQRTIDRPVLEYLLRRFGG